MSKTSCGISSRGSVDLSDYSPSGLREYMVASIDAFLRQIPGNSISEKLPAVARALGFREGRVNEYRHRKINRPYADEVWAVLHHAERIAASDARRAELRLNNEDLKNAFAGMGDPAGRQAALLRIAGCRSGEQCGGVAAGQMAAPRGSTTVSLSSFAGGVLGVEEIGIGRANPLHQRIAEVASQTAGEFTLAAADEMERLGLADLAWLYRDDDALPALHVGAGITILSTEQRERIIGQPIEDQPLPPVLLSVVADQLRACMHVKARPTVHRIKAVVGGEVRTWDRLAIHFPRSRLIAGSCVMVGA